MPKKNYQIIPFIGGLTFQSEKGTSVIEKVGKKITVFSTTGKGFKPSKIKFSKK